jgi:uncharacterized membrane protein
LEYTRGREGRRMFETIYNLISIPLSILFLFGIIGAFVNGFSDLVRNIRANRNKTTGSIETFVIIAIIVLIGLTLVHFGVHPGGTHGILDY